jgi:hypothetical protein
MSMAHRSTTNNQTEYAGLIAGLQAEARHRWPNLEVVGDSALILRQLRDYRPPKNTRLLRLYSQARRLADQLDVRHWTHHVRARNKMADSSQPSHGYPHQLAGAPSYGTLWACDTYGPFEQRPQPVAGRHCRPAGWSLCSVLVFPLKLLGTYYCA